MLRYDQPGSPYNTPGAPNASLGHLLEIQLPCATTLGTNRLTDVTTAGDSSAAISYGYDATGAITSATRQGTTHHLHYGADGRIARLTASGNAADPQAVSYHYNGLGQRIAKTDTRASTSAPHIEHTLYSDEDGTQPLGTYGNQRSAGSAAPAGESDSTEVIYLPTATGLMPIAAHINGRLYAIHTDHLNTPRRLTNAQGQVAWQWLVTGFGEVNPTTGAGGYLQQGNGYTYSEPVTFHLRYPGQQWDEETGLAYNLHRYYDAQSGRYIQADPIGLEGGWNRFGYVGGNPLSYTDPLGLWAVGDPLPQGLVNTSAGVGDGILATLSFGFASGQQIRNGLNIGSVDKCSPEYRAGQVAGTAATMAIYAGGAIPRTLTHFTTSAGAAGIARSGSILPSTGLTLFGDGVYATAGSRIFVPGAATIPMTVSGAGFMRLVPNAAFLNGGSLQTGLVFAGYGAAANYNAESGGCTCK